MSNRNEPVAESEPIVMLTGGVLSNECCGDKVSSGSGPMNGLSFSVSPRAKGRNGTEPRERNVSQFYVQVRRRNARIGGFGG